MGLLQDFGDIIELNIFLFVHAYAPHVGRNAHSKQLTGLRGKNKPSPFLSYFVGRAKWFRPRGDSGNEIWEYDFSRMHSKPANFIPYVSLIGSGAEGDKKSLVIFFRQEQIVRQYTVSSSKVDISQGLITR